MDKTKYSEYGFSFSINDGFVNIRNKSSSISFTKEEFTNFVCDLNYWAKKNTGKPCSCDAESFFIEGVHECSSCHCIYWI